MPSVSVMSRGKGGQLAALNDEVKALKCLHLDALGLVDADQLVAGDQRARAVVAVPSLRAPGMRFLKRGRRRIADHGNSIPYESRKVQVGVKYAGRCCRACMGLPCRNFRMNGLGAPRAQNYRVHWPGVTTIRSESSKSFIPNEGCLLSRDIASSGRGRGTRRSAVRAQLRLPIPPLLTPRQRRWETGHGGQND